VRSSSVLLSVNLTLVVPQLQPFYRWAEPLSWALIRITAGLMLIPHGWRKLMAGIGPVAANALAKRGIQCRSSAGPTAATNTLFWGLVMLAIALGGGGPYSLDRRIGREL
jgi:uncharacterized membrane protein YphA (DoxX/SURF4 family)